ncbi:MAG TPA: hypothetical protein VEI07_04645 [Planctomycetaceae bacterium]|nr:hypothetical protein [Planctomycetaceae bacterium]
MDLPQYLQGFSFRFVQPEQRQSRISRAAAAALARLPVPLDALNTRLPFDRSNMRRKLRGTRVGSGGPPLAIRAILNRGVAHLADREAFVAFGMGDGDSLLAAIAGNDDKICIGIRDRDAKQPHAAFVRRFSERSSGSCHFVAESFTQCVTQLGERPIGLCLVSAQSHEPIAPRLAECEPHLGENAFLLVENCNCERTREAAFEFVAASRNQYRLLMEVRTPEPCSLTWGRGLLVMQLLGRNAVVPAHSERGRSPLLLPAA